MECDPYDLTILYTADTIQWCEYLFDIFKDFEIQQNSEDITEFPSHLSTLQNIQESLVTVVIISPRFLQKCTPKMQDYVHKVVGLICGVDDADMEELLEKIPSSKDWYQVEAVAGSSEISKVVLKVLHDANDEKQQRRHGEMEDTYITMNEGEDFIQSDYIEMVGVKGDDNRLENTYFPPEDTYETMMPAPADRAPAAPVRSGHVFKTTSIGYVDMTEAKHLSQCSSGMTIQPERSRSGEEALLYILFQEPLISVQDQYTVSFQGRLKKSDVIAKLKNSYTLQVDLPKDHPAELTDVQVTGPNRNVLGTFKFIFTSVMDELADVLQNIIDPMKFMCQALGISTADANELDNKLYEHIKRCIPSGGLNLLVGQIGGEQKALTEVPTALHFAAKYGLKNICSMLITCPGAVQAMKLKNRSDLTPDVLAGKNGHSDLKSFLENFVEVAEDEEISTEGGPSSSYMFMRTGMFYYNQQELLKQSSTEQISDYDSPFHVPIPASGVPLTREETIKKLIQGKQEDIEEYYGSLTLDMGTFERDQDGDEDYERVEEQIGPRKLSGKKVGPRRPPPRQLSDGKPSMPEFPPPIVEPRLPAPPPPPPPPTEVESEAPEKPLPRKNVKAIDVLGGRPVATGQQHLIEIQNRVKNQEMTVDEAVLLFKNWELLQDRSSFSTQAETFKALKQQKQKAKQGGFTGLFKKPAKKGAQQQLQISQKPQEKLIQSEISVQNRPTSTTSLDSHGSRDSSYNSAPDELEQERYTTASHPSSSIMPVTRRRPDQKDRINRLSVAYDQLPTISQKTMPPVPSRSAAAKPAFSLPPQPSIQSLPRPSLPYVHYQGPPAPPEEEQSNYVDFDEGTPEDLPGLPPPPPPMDMSAERSSDSTCPISPSHGSRSLDTPTSKYPPVVQRQVPGKPRPVPRPRNVSNPQLPK